MADRLYITTLARCSKRPAPRDIINTSETADERIDALADTTGVDFMPDPEIDHLVDFYIGRGR